MRRLSGQAARHCARVLHWLLEITEILGVIVAIAVAILAWRLSQGIAKVLIIIGFF